MSSSTSTSTSATSPAAASHCASTGAIAATDLGSAQPMTDGSQRLDLTIAGMTCGHCVTSVREALESLPGVAVDHVRIGKASVTLAPEGASPAALIEAIREAGYQAAFSASAGTDAKVGLPQATTGGSCCSSR